MEAVSVWLRAAAADASEMYAAWGLAEGEVELALDAAERMASWVLPSIPVAYLVTVLFWVRPRLPLLGYPMATGAFEDYRNDEWLAAVFAISGIGTLALSGTARWVIWPRRWKKPRFCISLALTRPQMMRTSKPCCRNVMTPLII